MIVYLASAVIVAFSKLSVGPSPRTKIFLFLSPILTEEVLSTSKIIIFFP